MTELTVDVAALERFVSRLELLAGHLGRVRADVDAQVGQLHVTWTGEAAERQAAAQRRWAAGADDVHAALAALRAVASIAHANYLAAVQANRGMWAR